ncbi:CAP domain-containing protein [Nocardioides massiliensis]|uniref:Uncharacterized protein YkwD n=1 Tax=Nocardioides massiliensis TaxID=1325935 RepID=A0ABT9NPH0_9ACTN|nr:CAP domain-containing protein [Nocardioides massiliensis]MDP9822196.1 uncharacterized protein YkwD [Nocardioides massiliensis]
MRSWNRPAVLVAAAALTVSGLTAGTATGSDADVPAGDQAPAPAAHSAPSAPGAGFGLAANGRSAQAINTKSKAAVRRAYRQRYAPTMEVPTGWTGSYAGCKAGNVTKRSRAATRQAINLVRAMAGLDPVGFRQNLNVQSQRAALMMGANQSLSHYPPRSWKCWSKAGAQAAQTGNLALRWPELRSGRVVEQYVDDEGSNNRAVGHRRWILNPATRWMGTGSTDIANAMVVVTPPAAGRATPRWIPWPTAGWFPNQMEPKGRWSFSSSDPRHDFSHALVAVRVVNGRKLKVTRHRPEVGAGPNTLVWQVKPRASRAHRVTITGIRDASTGKRFKRSYVVRLFNAR